MGEGAEEQHATTKGEKLELEEAKRREWKWVCLSLNLKRKLKVLEECGKRGSNGEEARELARREFMAIDLRSPFTRNVYFI